MSGRDTILGSYVTLLEGITKANGYLTNIKQVHRKILTYEKVREFPCLMVMGGGESFEYTMDLSVNSTLMIYINGYSMDQKDPDGALCNIISDVIKRINSSSNTYLERTALMELETDEGSFHLELEGLGAFTLTLQVIYRFARDNP